VSGYRERVTLRGEEYGCSESERAIYPAEGEGFSLLNLGRFPEWEDAGCSVEGTESTVGRACR